MGGPRWIGLLCSLSSHIASDPPRWNSCWYCFVICRYTLTRWMGSSLFVLGICLEEGKYHIRAHTHSAFVTTVLILCYKLLESKVYFVFFSARPTRLDTGKQQKRRDRWIYQRRTSCTLVDEATRCISRTDFRLDGNKVYEGMEKPSSWGGLILKVLYHKLIELDTTTIPFCRSSTILVVIISALLLMRR